VCRLLRDVVRIFQRVELKSVIQQGIDLVSSDTCEVELARATVQLDSTALQLADARTELNAAQSQLQQCRDQCQALHVSRDSYVSKLRRAADILQKRKAKYVRAKQSLVSLAVHTSLAGSSSNQCFASHSLICQHVDTLLGDGADMIRPHARTSWWHCNCNRSFIRAIPFT